MRSGGRTRPRSPLIQRMAQRRGLAQTVVDTRQRSRRIELGPKTGGVVNVYRVRAAQAAPGGGGGGDPDAIHDNVAGEIAAIAEKVAPIGTDLLVLEDSAAGNAKKRVQVGNLPGGGSGDVTGEDIWWIDGMMGV